MRLAELAGQQTKGLLLIRLEESWKTGASDRRLWSSAIAADARLATFLENGVAQGSIPRRDLHCRRRQPDPGLLHTLQPGISSARTPASRKRLLALGPLGSDPTHLLARAGLRDPHPHRPPRGPAPHLHHPGAGVDGPAPRFSPARPAVDRRRQPDSSLRFAAIRLSAGGLRLAQPEPHRGGHRPHPSRRGRP